jgi:hypothetical protein
MEINDIIVLDNNERYLLLKKMTENENNYFLAEKDDKEDKKIIVLKEVHSKDETYVEIIKDLKLKNYYLEKLKDAK